MIRRIFVSIGISLWILCLTQIGWAVYGEIQDDGNIEGLWHLENLNDTTGNHDCSITGTVTANDTGIFGKSYTFAGDTDYLDCGTDSLNLTNTFTMMLWMYNTNDSEHDEALGKNAGSGDYGWRINRYRVGDSFQFGYSTTGSDWSGNETANNTFEINKWYHFAVTYDGSNIRAYINGEESTDKDFPVSESSNIYESSVELRIGAAGILSRSWNGMIDEVMIRTDVALSAAEIRRIYALQKGRFQIIGALQHMPESDHIDATYTSPSMLSWYLDPEYGITTVA